jgi:hypothetical protein
MFSACGKSRPDLPTRNAYRPIRGGRVARGVLRSRDFEDGKWRKFQLYRPSADSLKQTRSLGGAARPAVGRRVQVPRWPVPATEAQDSISPSGSGRPVRDITGYARGRHQRGPSSLFLGWENPPRC